jgi:hypothetical protein
VTIVSPAESAGRVEIADWIELLLVTRNSPRFSRADLLGWLQLEEDTQHGELDAWGDELEISQTDDYAIVDDVYEELLRRADILGERYPFSLEHFGNQWVIQDASFSRRGGHRVSNEAYILCLLMSVIRKGIVQYPAGDQTASSIDHLFQALSVAVAKAWMRGEAYWFGSPRPDGTTTLVAGLTELIRLTGYGRLKDPLPASRNNRENDGGIDVVAWRPFADGLTAFVLFGQAASGKNYKGKDVGSRLVPDFKWFFQEFFAEHYMTALFIPFIQHDFWKPLKSEDYELAARDHALHNESRFGLVFDRLRITEVSSDILEVYDFSESIHLAGVARSALTWIRQLQRSSL